MVEQKADKAIRGMEKEQRILGRFLGDSRPYTQRIQGGDFK